MALWTLICPQCLFYLKGAIIMKDIPNLFGSLVFNDNVMKERLPKETYKALKNLLLVIFFNNVCPLITKYYCICITVSE